jgi:hypothetical protein
VLVLGSVEEGKIRMINSYIKFNLHFNAKLFENELK